MSSREEPSQTQPDPRWEVQPEPLDDEPEPERRNLLRIVLAAVLVALATCVFLALATRSV